MMILIMTAVISSQSGGPTGSYLGNKSIYIPMKHVSCGPHCKTHKPAAVAKGLNLKYRFGMKCPRKRKVTYLAYQVPGGSRHVLRSGNSGVRKYAVNRNVRLFSNYQLGEMCRHKLGDNFTSMRGHGRVNRRARVSATKYLKIIGRCSGWKENKIKRKAVRISIRCNDRNH